MGINTNFLLKCEIVIVKTFSGFESYHNIPFHSISWSGSPNVLYKESNHSDFWFWLNTCILVCIFISKMELRPRLPISADNEGEELWKL